MKYMIFDKSDNERVSIHIYDTEQKCKDSVIWDSDFYYICEFADDYNFSKLLKSTIIPTCSTADDKDLLVTTFTISYDVTRYNKIIALETFDLIKNWCKGEAEGCEESFLDLGIEDKTDTRYQAYKAEKTSIKSSQRNKKL